MADLTAAGGSAGRNSVRSFWRKCEGAAALEFGLIAAPFFIIIMGIIEFSIVLFLNAALEAGVINASRGGAIGSTPPGMTREEMVVDVLNQHGFGLITIEPADVTTLVYPTFDSIGQPEPYVDANTNGSYDGGEDFTDVNGNGTWDADMGAAGLGGPSDVVVYRVDYTWGLLTDLLRPAIGNLTLTSSIAVRNEPF